MRHELTPDCGIKGCTRAAFKGELCRMHYALVPDRMRRDCMGEVMATSHAIAIKHHKRQLAFVRKHLSGVGET